MFFHCCQPRCLTVATSPRPSSAHFVAHFEGSSSHGSSRLRGRLKTLLGNGNKTGAITFQVSPQIAIGFPPADNDVDILRLQLHYCGRPAGLLAGDQRGSRSPERIEHAVAAPAAIANRPLNQTHRLHGGMKAIHLGLGHEPYIALVASSAPEMLLLIPPAIQNRFVAALVIGSSQCETVLGPNQECRPVSSGRSKSP